MPQGKGWRWGPCGQESRAEPQGRMMCPCLLRSLRYSPACQLAATAHPPGAPVACRIPLAGPFPRRLLRKAERASRYFEGEGLETFIAEGQEDPVTGALVRFSPHFVLQAACLAPHLLHLLAQEGRWLGEACRGTAACL